MIIRVLAGTCLALMVLVAVLFIVLHNIASIVTDVLPRVKK